MRDGVTAVTHDCVNEENEKFFYINMKLFAAMYKRSEYHFDMNRKHSRETAKRFMSYALKYRPNMVLKHRQRRGEPFLTSGNHDVNLVGRGGRRNAFCFPKDTQTLCDVSKSECINKT